MDPLSSLIGSALSTAKDSFSVQALRDQVSLWKDRALLMEKEIELLKKENEFLKLNAKDENFTDAGPFLVKKNPAGGYFPGGFCPKCKIALYQDRSQRSHPFVCGHCKLTIGYAVYISTLEPFKSQGIPGAS